MIAPRQIDTCSHPGFRDDRMARLAEIEASHFWFAARAALVDDRLARHVAERNARVLDFGCGTGRGVVEQRIAGRNVTGADPHIAGLAAWRASGSRPPLVRAVSPGLPFRKAAFAASLLLDVLEHVDDDVLLREIRDVLHPGGIVIATVPALPFLWSFRDDDAGHLRRYTRRSLRDAFSRAGFTVLSVDYYLFLLLPVIIATRLLGRRSARLRDVEETIPGPIDSVARAVARLERALGRRIRWPAGASLIAVARRD